MWTKLGEDVVEMMPEMVDGANPELSPVQLRMQALSSTKVLALRLRQLPASFSSSWAQFESNCPDNHLLHLFYGLQHGW